MTDTVAVAAYGLTKNYGHRRAIERVTFEVERGQICGLLGPNGAGKTTTMRVLAGLSRPDGREEGMSLLFRRFWRTGLYALYTRRLRLQVLTGPLPEHVGLIMDGNRRWARQAGLASPSLGHRAGAEHVEQVLSWCEAVGIKEVTVFICSTENLSRRADAEVAYLMRVIEEVIAARLARPGSGWQVHVVGLLDVLPDSTARALKDAVEQTRDCTTGAHLTLAIGYGGRQEIVDAVRDLLGEADAAGTSMAGLAERLTADDITAHLYTVGRPDPDLVIRTSGEQRMSNFLLWQSAYSELYFCEAYWPAFREIDFLRALRSYAARKRRFGS